MSQFTLGEYHKEHGLNRVRIECRAAADIAAIAAEWNALVRGAGLPPFLRTEFILPAMEHFGVPRGKLVLGRKEGSLVTAALLERKGPGRWQTWQPSQLPLGPCILASGVRWTEILKAILGGLPGMGMELSLTQMDPLFVPREAEAGTLENLDYVATGWIDISGTFEDFWSSRGKNLRQNLGKQRRRFEERGEVLRFEHLDSPAGVLAAFEDFARIESAGWKAEAGSAITPDNAQGRFYRDMLGRFASSGSAFALRLTLDGRPIAVDFGLQEGGVATILKTTYDEAFKSSSPAQLLHQSAFEFLFGRTLKRIEFYGKVMEWHTRWTDQSRMLYHLNYYRWPWLRTFKKSVRRQ